ncbi:hypothetical protein [Dysgonomonas sp. Marseille-P4361]|uniref:hypothetical protein n=1 Tax=Dysgonomonas sp. Marseille-P4361 TaxID=2161820 RepID=UPI000D5598FC|nr:hypothetical protein [Dysgonomonas sp. Marseille-P4361]
MIAELTLTTLIVSAFTELMYIMRDKKRIINRLFEIGVYTIIALLILLGMLLLAKLNGHFPAFAH